MSGLSQTMRLWRPATSIARTFSPAGQIAHLHQQGASRSAVVHEQALPQSQTQARVETPFLCKTRSQSTTSNESNLDTLISQIPLVQTLRQSHKAYEESRPHLAIPPAIRQHHLVGGSLAGPGKLAIAPYTWTFSEKSGTGSTRTGKVVSVFHIGRDLCGHPGFVHGGLLSVLFDEVFARCVSAAFPSGLGMTANLSVDFRKPALPDRVYVLRAETVKVEGRKAWVEGRMSYLPLAVPDGKTIVQDTELLREDNEGVVMVSEAKALFVEPKFADVSCSSLDD
jgi:acyl-coenzyme A thioesterase PaaI-like protein